ncbi:alkaline phosphatase D/5'-nucleotidase [Amycolatopsis arida]|uniref:5'-nucleotidase SurE n=1 Tax=Amycolatopsis arida TaxID=587909 RepID=A0A1I6AJV0_9PSEU|nr:5'/3'-nucleotidase SurE [Amycolatopsis arida]TDX87331.1 5'-nucleotidase [Amycolatopsis arida]SFQ68955.1 alkaline phosphatase D/5'-nucleotidase [Amycolatopsis arida]
MTSRWTSSVPALAAAVLAAGVLTGPAVAATPVAGPSGADAALDILLTNDDGYRAPTLAALRRALTAAGHRVTVVAPCDDQSGIGTKQVSNYPRGVPTPANTITATQPAPDVWAVCASPGDAVLFGVRNVLPAPPDLVVSGVNPGQNAGAVTNHSGTVGATIMAGELGIPAVAVSVEIDPTTDPPAVGSVPDAAAYTVRLVERLRVTAAGRPLLPRHVTLNVNYPVAAEPRGTLVTRTGRLAFVRPSFVPTDLCADCYLVRPELDLGPDPVPWSDNNALATDHIAVTPLDGDWTAAEEVRSNLRHRLAALR